MCVVGVSLSMEESSGYERIESEESTVDAELLVEGEGIKPEQVIRSSPVWVIPILLHLANLSNQGVLLPPDLGSRQITPASLTLLPVGLGDRAVCHHPRDQHQHRFQNTTAEPIKVEFAKLLLVTCRKSWRACPLPEIAWRRLYRRSRRWSSRGCTGTKKETYWHIQQVVNYEGN